MQRGFFEFLISVLFIVHDSYQYSIPEPTLELLSPKGFRISIPDESGIGFFAFNGAINRDLKGTSPGDFDGSVVKAVNGRWTYENSKQILIPGDTLSYWIHVQHNNLGYRLLDKNIIVPRDTKNKEVSVENTVDFENNSDSSISDTERLRIVNERINFLRNNIDNINNNRNTCALSKTIVNGQKVCSKALIFEENFEYFNWTRWERVLEIPSEKDDADFVSYQRFTSNCYITDGILHIVPTLLEDGYGFNEKSLRNGVMDLGKECTSEIDTDITCKRESGFSRILPPVISAKLRTKNFFAFRYGQVDIRAKLPIGDWSFPQLFLQPLNNDYGLNGFASGQLRIAFIRGNKFLKTINNEDISGKKLFGGAILASGENLRENWLKSKIQNEHFGNQFHTYTMVWDENSITLAVDGEAYATFQDGFKNSYQNFNLTHAKNWQSGDKMAPFDKEFYLEVGVSAGGISDFPDDSRTGSENKIKPWENLSPKAELQFWNDLSNWYPSWNKERAGMDIDYVRVWAI